MLTLTSFSLHTSHSLSPHPPPPVPAFHSFITGWRDATVLIGTDTKAVLKAFVTQQSVTNVTKRYGESNLFSDRAGPALPVKFRPHGGCREGCSRSRRLPADSARAAFFTTCWSPQSCKSPPPGGETRGCRGPRAAHQGPSPPPGRGGPAQASRGREPVPIGIAARAAAGTAAREAARWEQGQAWQPRRRESRAGKARGPGRRAWAPRGAARGCAARAGMGGGRRGRRGPAAGGRGAGPHIPAPPPPGEAHPGGTRLPHMGFRLVSPCPREMRPEMRTGEALSWLMCLRSDEQEH